MSQRHWTTRTPKNADLIRASNVPTIAGFSLLTLTELPEDSIVTEIGICFFTSPGSKKAILVFLLQLSLNSLWSLLFFGMHNPSLAFVEIVVLWLSILWTIIEFKKISKPAAWLLVPYLAWVTFASYLNLAVAILN
jgi:hypothetical protein